MIFSKIKEAFKSKFNEIFNNNEALDEIIDEIEELLILSDVGINTTSDICEKLRKEASKIQNISKEQIEELLRKIMIEKLEITKEQENIKNDFESKNVILVVGVNGVGKTTSIAKIANLYKNEGKKVLLAAR